MHGKDKYDIIKYLLTPLCMCVCVYLCVLSLDVKYFLLCLAVEKATGLSQSCKFHPPPCQWLIQEPQSKPVCSWNSSCSRNWFWMGPRSNVAQSTRTMDKGTFRLLIHEYREACKSSCYWVPEEESANEVKDGHNLDPCRHCGTALLTGLKAHS